MKRDCWLDRIAVPSLRQSLAQLKFVAECLNTEEDPLQTNVKFHVDNAIEQVAKALAEAAA